MHIFLRSQVMGVPIIVREALWPWHTSLTCVFLRVENLQRLQILGNKGWACHLVLMRSWSNTHFSLCLTSPLLSSYPSSQSHGSLLLRHLSHGHRWFPFSLELSLLSPFQREPLGGSPGPTSSVKIKSGHKPPFLWQVSQEAVWTSWNLRAFFYFFHLTYITLP